MISPDRRMFLKVTGVLAGALILGPGQTENPEITRQLADNARIFASWANTLVENLGKRHQFSLPEKLTSLKPADYSPYVLATTMQRSPLSVGMANPEFADQWLSPEPRIAASSGRQPEVESPATTEVQVAVHTLIQKFVAILVPATDRERIRKIYASSLERSTQGLLQIPTQEIKRRSELTEEKARKIIRLIIQASVPQVRLELPAQKTHRFKLGEHNGTIFQIMIHDIGMLQTMVAHPEVFDRRFFGRFNDPYLNDLKTAGAFAVTRILPPIAAWLATDLLWQPSREEVFAGKIVDPDYLTPAVAERAKGTLNFVLNGSQASSDGPISADQLEETQTKLRGAYREFQSAILV